MRPCRFAVRRGAELVYHGGAELEAAYVRYIILCNSKPWLAHVTRLLFTPRDSDGGGPDKDPDSEIGGPDNTLGGGGSGLSRLVF